MGKIKGILIANLFIISVFLIVFSLSGCANNARTGALAGGGIGALAGQLVGHNTASTLIGAGIGLGTGYLIGNEMDKSKASKHELEQTYTPLGGTKWKVVEIIPANKVPRFISKVISFQNDGSVTTTTVYPDKSKDIATESYRIMGNTLIVNRKGYLINYRFSISGDTMTASAEEVRVILKRLM